LLPQAIDLLALRAMPEVAAMLRSRCPRIVERWAEAVARHLPDADPLTVKQVRDSIPSVLDKIALALEVAGPEATVVLAEVSTAHGLARFQEHYKIEEVVTEYRLLRRITFDELHAASEGKLTFADFVAVDIGIDIAMQRGIVSFVRYLTDQVRAAAVTESKYLAFLSHDLRNNLNGVTLTLEWLHQRLSAEPDLRDASDDLAALQQSINETVEGMDRLLQNERLRREQITLKLAPVDLRRMADDQIAQVARKAAAKGVRIENDIPAGAGATSDRELVTLVLQNLLGNAVKYCDRGVIRVTAEEDELGWCLSVSDTGPGIAPDRLSTLFEAFTRGETHGQPGLGLGLSIASHAARLLGSDLRVESTVGKGSRFSFNLPPSAGEPTR
jgi:signal transduction histidine kinase